ncbi:MAG: antibiotic biosynthesis monooxygenase [Planctomycetes bacterium]|nr:antibiotic biosynthesis monooxygenase [Planctomycetota bacterium]
MAGTNVIIIAKAKAKPGMEEEVKKELMALIGPTRSEEGCVQYNLHQSADNPSVFMFYENWISQEAFNEHIQTMHLQSLLNKADELFAEPLDVTPWEIID